MKPENTKTPKKPLLDQDNNNTLLGIQIVLMILIIAIGIFPLSRKMIKLQRELTETAQESYQQEAEKINEKNSLEKFKKLSDIAVLEQALPSEKDIIKFIETFENAGQNNKVTQNLVLKTESKKDTGTYVVIPLTINIEGSLGYIVQFLKDIEKSDFYLEPKNIAIGSNITDDNQTLILEADSF